MPYFYDVNLDPNRNRSDPNAVQISGAQAVAGPTGSTAPNQGKSRDVQSGSGFQNLEKYLTANQPQAFGTQVLGKVGGQVEQAGQQMQNAGEQFKQQVAGANYVPTSQEVSKAIANPASANAEQFKAFRTQEYGGPKNLAENQDAWNKYWSGAQQAKTNAGLLGNEAGRFTLLDQYFGKPTYGFGQKSLDNLLVQQSGLGRQARDVQNQATALQSTGNEQAKKLQEFASQRAGEVEKARADTLAQLGVNAQGQLLTGSDAGALGKQYQNVESELAAANANRLGQRQDIQNSVQQGAFTADQLKKLGLSAGANLYDIDLSRYLTQGQDLTRDQVMSPDQRAYIQALSNLAGYTDNFASGTPQSAGEAYTYDTGALKSALNQRAADFENASKNTDVNVSWTPGYQINLAPNMPMSDLMYKINEAQNWLKDPYRTVRPSFVGDRASAEEFVNKGTQAANVAQKQLADKYNIMRKVGVR
jgi:hypothetical protein